MDLFFYEAEQRIDEEDLLKKIDSLLDWSSFHSILTGGLNRSDLGRTGYEPLLLFKCLLLGQWHCLYDPKL